MAILRVFFFCLAIKLIMSCKSSESAESSQKNSLEAHKKDSSISEDSAQDLNQLEANIVNVSEYSAPCPSQLEECIEDITAEGVHEESKQIKPMLLLNHHEFTRIRNHIIAKKEPFYTNFHHIKARLPRYDDSQEVYLGKDVFKFREHLSENAALGAFYYALAYLIEGEIPFLNKAANFLKSWATSSLHGINNIDDFDGQYKEKANVGLQLGIGFKRMAYVYDIVKNTKILTESEHSDILAWFRKGYKLIREAFLRWPTLVNKCHEFSNHRTIHIATMLTLGYITENQQWIDSAIYSGNMQSPGWKDILPAIIYKENEAIIGCDRIIGNPPVAGEVVDRYRHHSDPDSSPEEDHNRGFGYSLLSLSHLAMAAEVALNNGVDLYRYVAPSGENLLMSLRFLGSIKAAHGRGDQPIRANGISGEENYINELMKDSYSGVFEHFSKRFHNHSSVMAPLLDYALHERIYSAPEFFGKFPTEDISWHFDFNSVSEGWQPRNHIANFHVYNGCLHLSSIGEDPGIFIDNISIDSERYVKLKIKIKLDAKNASENALLQVFWSTETTPVQTYGPVSESFVLDAEEQEVTMDFSEHPDWQGQVTRIRIDPLNVAKVSLAIDEIHLLAP